MKHERPLCKTCPKHELYCKRTCEEWIAYEEEYQAEKRFYKDKPEDAIIGYDGELRKKKLMHNEREYRKWYGNTK